MWKDFSIKRDRKDWDYLIRDETNKRGHDRDYRIVTSMQKVKGVPLLALFLYDRERFN